MVKNYLKPTSFSLLQKLVKMPTFMLLISSSQVNFQSKQAGWLSLTFFCKRELTGGTLVLSQIETGKDGWMSGVEAYEGDLKVSLLKRNALLQLWICSQNQILQYNTKAKIAKAFRGFEPRHHSTDLTVPQILQLIG